MQGNVRRSSRLLVRSALGAAVLAMSASAAMGQSYSFGTCGQGGASGPDQGMCDTAYTSTNLAGAVTVSGGIQSWTVPKTGLYTIVARGAQGGTQVYGAGYPGGLGAAAGGVFSLTAGQTVYVLVGQKGGDTQFVEGDEDGIENAAPGGGGGSFVYLSPTSAFPLLAAGGGGSGARCSSTTAANQAGSGGINGNRSGSLDNGGKGGNGGRSNAASDDSYWAGGGAGWLTDGTAGANPTDYDPASVGYGSAEGGRAVRNGAAGGARWDDGYDEGGDGGFGGGGGGGSANMGGGGGGGFSGGGGAAYAPCGNEPGGGGGSYSGGSSPVLLAAANSGDGTVTITLGGTVAAVAPVPATTSWELVLMTLALAGIGTFVIRRSRG